MLRTGFRCRLPPVQCILLVNSVGKDDFARLDVYQLDTGLIVRLDLANEHLFRPACLDVIGYTIKFVVSLFLVGNNRYRHSLLLKGSRKIDVKAVGGLDVDLGTAGYLRDIMC